MSTKMIRQSAFVWIALWAVFVQADAISIEGGRIVGSTQDPVRIYKGIPFAAPPVGDLRWKDPQPVRPWQGVRKCDAFGPSCPQAPYPKGSLYDRPFTEPLREDCLYLNLWTAARDADERRPVMVWIHGGGLTRGSASHPVYDGSALAKKGVVLVSINYRLGPFGFLAHPELSKESAHDSSGNYGLLDQIAALRWVQRNIAAFGGDPDRVTIFGESAGSWSVNALVASPLAKGLFHRAIGESGASFGPGTFLKQARNGKKSAEQIGLEFAAVAGVDSIRALRALPAERILEIATKDPKGRKLRMRPNVDGWVLPEEIRTIFAQGRQNDVPVLLGSNANEMTSLTNPLEMPLSTKAYRKRIRKQYGDLADEYEKVYPVESFSDIKDAYLGGMRDRSFSLGMRTWARMTVKGKSKAYLYFFTRVPPIPNSEFYGAFHASEIAYAFGNLGRMGRFSRDADRQPSETDQRLADVMSAYWVNFAKTGNPNGAGLPEWVPYDRQSESYLNLGERVRLEHHLLKKQLDFMERHLVQSAGR